MNSICFTGHRFINNSESLKSRLTFLIEQLIEKGGEDFYAGGAIGFDTLAAKAVTELKTAYPQIKLHLILPCAGSEQTMKWTAENREEYQKILSEADSVEYVSEHYYNGCMKARNARFVSLADCLVCFFDKSNSACGTGQTVRMAERKNILIINLYSEK